MALADFWREKHFIALTICNQRLSSSQVKRRSKPEKFFPFFFKLMSLFVPWQDNRKPLQMFK